MADQASSVMTDLAAKPLLDCNHAGRSGQYLRALIYSSSTRENETSGRLSISHTTLML